MGRPASEDGIGGRTKLLVVTASIACMVVSLLYMLSATAPLWYFHGYVEGHYSLLNHKLYYIYDGQPVSTPHTDYVRHVSMTFALLSLGLLILSLLSILLVGRRPTAASGLIYGVAAGLGVQYGLLNGYLRRAIEFDIGRFAYLMGKPNNEIVFRTSAGTILFEGIRIESALVHELVFRSVTSLVLLALAITASSIAAAIALRKFYESETKQAKQKTGSWLAELRRGSTYVALFMSSLVVLASVFAYYPSSIVVSPQPPLATLEPPLYEYTCASLIRSIRGALAYTDFETFPVLGWTSYGGAWELSLGGGFRGNALRGRDNNGGVGRVSSQYYWNTRIDDYSSLWVSLRTRAETSDGYKGIGLLNAARNRLYEISVQSTAAIYKWDGARRLLASTSVPGYIATRWYTLVLFYNDRGTAVDLSVWIYDDTGSLVASLSASDTGGTRFRPAYAGVTIDAITTLWFRFDDFIVSTVDPRRILFTGFYSDMIVEIWDNLGNLVNSTTSPTTSFPLGVTRDIVAGTGINGRIVVKYPDTYACGVLTVPMTDAILGGDTYTLSTQPISWSLGANKTSTSVTVYISGSSTFSTTVRFLRISASQVFYARLVLNSISAPSALNLDLWMSGMTKSTNITIRNGVPVSTSTNIIQLNLGGDNYHVLSGYFTTTGQSATLHLRLELCTALGGRGACVSYPLFVVLMSGSSASAAPAIMPVEEIYTG